jgi:hypothetical protein
VQTEEAPPPAPRQAGHQALQLGDPLLPGQRAVT